MAGPARWGACRSFPIDYAPTRRKNVPKMRGRVSLQSGVDPVVPMLAVPLSEEESSYIMNHYDRCLCSECLKNLKAESHKDGYRKRS